MSTISTRTNWSLRTGGMVKEQTLMNVELSEMDYRQAYLDWENGEIMENLVHFLSYVGKIQDK